MNSPTLWIAWKLLFNKKSLIKGSVLFAFAGLVLGVASLVVSMAVMSGFESTLKQALADVTGHVQVLQRSRSQDDWHDLENRIRNLEPSLTSSTRFVFVEALMAKHGELATVVIQGLDPARMNQVLRLGRRVIDGKDTLAPAADGTPGIFIGKGLAQKMEVGVGDSIKVVVPVANDLNQGEFKRNIGVFKINAILDLGKYDWNERFIVADLRSTQKIAEIGDHYTGLLLRFKDIDYARQASFHLSQALGAPFWVRDWREANENLFEAVVMERVVIFFVVLIIVLVAAFNIASTLFVSVVQRYSDIAILKTVGMTERGVMRIFSLQGLLIGLWGLVLGSLLGFVLSLLFGWAENSFRLVAGSVYQIDGIQVNIRMVDLGAVWLATLLICFVATLAPARRGSKLNPVEGLRNG